MAERVVNQLESVYIQANYSNKAIITAGIVECDMYLLKKIGDGSAAQLAHHSGLGKRGYRLPGVPERYLETPPQNSRVFHLVRRSPK